jgi:hypothetical protein
VDDEQRAEFERAYRENIEREQLEAARAKLNVEQLARLDWHAERLREKEVYALRHEIALAGILRTDDRPHQQQVQINDVRKRAEYEARDGAHKDQVIAYARALKEAEQRQQQQALNNLSEQRRKQEAEVIARRQRDFETSQMLRNAEELDRQRRQTERYNGVRRSEDSPQKEGIKEKENDWQRVGREVLNNSAQKAQTQTLSRGGRKM